ncbi:hypothetical protein AX16_001628 [Volvariella volvacea WC 439]|nr:hypothetical protein AX16_001628 [Volvariella volvacea WC 439]
MLLASLFLAAFARSLASPVSATVPGTTVPSPLCVVSAALTASQCDPTRTRTIYDILYSCIGVILLCTYISIHHNIPDQNDSWAKVTWIKIRTTLYALLAPEVVIMWAIRQRIMAGRIAEENKHRGWTKTHGFFVQMGGLMQHVGGGQGGYQIVGTTTGRKDMTVDWKGIKIPRIPEKEIMDHGKGDILAKAIVLLQTTWFVAQCIARRFQGLVLTEIELVTLAFAALNGITYGLWWNKPLNIGYPIYFDENGNRVDGPEERKREGAWHDRIWAGVKGWLSGWREGGRGYQPLNEGDSDQRGVMKTLLMNTIIIPFKAIFLPLRDMMQEEGETNRLTSVHPFYAAEMDGEAQQLAVIYGSLIGVLFGGIHLIGWDFQFPTTTELWLWRTSSLILTIIPLGFVLSYTFSLAYGRTSSSFMEGVYKVIAVAFAYPHIFLGPPLYCAARIALLFLAFFTLRDLPDSAYRNVQWTEFVPHI